MKYITVSEASKKWNINERRVRTLLKEKRIEGAILQGHKYLIPEENRLQIFGNKFVENNKENCQISRRILESH